MKRSFTVFLAFMLISGSFFLSSCKEKTATTGSLAITALIKDGGPAANVQLFLAASREDLDNKNYMKSGYTNGAGSIIFRELPSAYYWYRVDGWDDYGAAEVFNGTDMSVILWLNTPSPSSPLK
ncbi:MAG: hypothetical protein NTU98_07180 [Bacteroidetes bacterium]|nr:hypothetical protein [Bacteroidota bacterium]